MDYAKLARRLGDRLIEVLPPLVRLVVEDDKIEITSADPEARGQRAPHVRYHLAHWASWLTSDETEPVDERALLAEHCSQFLDRLQDAVAEVTSDPWPGVRTMPEPVVKIKNDVLFVSFELDGHTVLELRPLPLQGL